MLTQPIDEVKAGGIVSAAGSSTFLILEPLNWIGPNALKPSGRDDLRVELDGILLNLLPLPLASSSSTETPCPTPSSDPTPTSKVKVILLSDL